jgi:hypothetical protein
MDYKVKLKQYSLSYISQQFINYYDEFKQLYIITHEVSSKLENDFLEIEIERALAATTLITIIDQDFIFLNNYILAFFCKKYINQAIDKQLECICVNNNELPDFHRLESVFYELINFLNRAIRSQENLNYYKVHQDLKKALTEKQCQHLFGLNNYPIILFCSHMNIHQNTYDNARNKSKNSEKYNA